MLQVSQAKEERRRERMNPSFFHYLFFSGYQWLGWLFALLSPPVTNANLLWKHLHRHNQKSCLTCYLDIPWSSQVHILSWLPYPVPLKLHCGPGETECGRSESGHCSSQKSYSLRGSQGYHGLSL
jgi:hypothetical protein